MDLEKKKKVIDLTVKGVGFAILGFVVAPFIFATIQGMAGLVIAGGIALTVNAFIPYFSLKIANWRIQALKAEAAQNPIETLQNDYLIKKDALSRFADSIRTFRGEIGIFASKLEEFKKLYPKDAKKFDDNHDRMKQLLKLREDKYKEANQSLKNYENEIARANSMWEMAKAAARMNDASGIVNEEDFLQKIQKETALDSVTRGMETAFADLETAILNEEVDAKQNTYVQSTETSKVTIPRQQIQA